MATRSCSCAKPRYPTSSIVMTQTLIGNSHPASEAHPLRCTPASRTTPAAICPSTTTRSVGADVGMNVEASAYQFSGPPANEGPSEYSHELRRMRYDAVRLGAEAPE